MQKLAVVVLLFSTISFVNCGGNADKFANEMAVTDSLREQLSLAFEKYKGVDTNAVLNIYQELLKTEKFAGLALNYQAIEKLKSDIKLTLNSDRLIRKQVKITEARLKGLKQSLRHREQSELTFDTHIKQAKKEVDDLRKFEEMIAGKLNSWTLNTDSLYSTLK